MSASPVRVTTVKTFLKDRTGLRVGDATAAFMVELLTTVAERIADAAKETTLTESRNTLMERDLEAAFEGFLESEGPTLYSPPTIHAAIDGITNEDLTRLINLLRADIETPR